MARTLSDWTSLSNIHSGFVFARSNPSIFDRWSWIVNTISEDHQCAKDDIDAREDDDGREFITVRGEVVAEIHAGYFHNVAPVALLQQAAE